MKVKLIKLNYADKTNNWHSADMEIVNPQEAKDEFPKGFTPKNNIITCTGYFPINEKACYEVIGEFGLTENYGYQYEVYKYKEILPTTKEGIISYLASGLIKGVNIKIATLIVDRFAEKTLNIFNDSPERLLEVRGIGRKKLEKIVEAYESSKAMASIISILAPIGIKQNQCLKIQQHFRDESMDVINNNTYKLCEILNFKTVDKIAQKTMVGRLNDKLRIRAAYKYVLSEASLEGHMCLPQDELIYKTFILLNSPDEKLKIKWTSIKKFLADHDRCTLNAFIRKPLDCSLDDCINELKSMASEKVLMGCNNFAFTSEYYNEEVEIAKNIVNRINNKSTKKFSDEVINKTLESLEKENGITLATMQKKAVVMGVNESFSIITGGPGTGKTTCLKLVLLTSQKLHNIKCEDVVLLAPTGRAASRMGESVGSEYTSSTIHSALGIGVDSTQRTQKLSGKIFVVDESSMLDSNICSRLLKAIPDDGKVILIGDPEQLPSVGAGNVLYELLKCNEVPKTELDTIYRQSGVNPIVVNSKLIKKGITNLQYNELFKFVEVNNTTDSDISNSTAKMVLKEYLDAVKESGVDNVEILCPYRKAGVPAGAFELNKKAQSILNPDSSGICCGKLSFKVNDKVIQIKNNNKYGYYNGDVGYITDITDDEEVVISFDNKEAVYDAQQMQDVNLAYAISIHKSQGSEYKTVIIPLITQFFPMLKRNLLYTGITRAKEKVIIVGQQKAVEMAISNNDISKRNTLLGYQIKKLLNERK